MGSTSGTGHTRRAAFGLAALICVALVAGACLVLAAGPAGAARDGRGALAGVPAGAHVAKGAASATQEAKLTAADAAEGDSFGRSVAVSGDTAVVGAPGRAAGAEASAGSVYVYTQAPGGWAQQTVLTASDGTADSTFGASVAISGDTIVVGAPRHSTAAGEEAGAAYVFVRSGGAWTQQAVLTASDGAAYDWYGDSVAVAGDTALVGATYHATAGGEESGAAYVYTRIGASWSLQSQFTAADAGAGDWFGTAVALSGETALVGADGHGPGAAYVFSRSGTVWSQSAALSPSGGAAGDGFGAAVALGSGSALIGAPGRNAGTGAAYVFSGSGSSWTQAGVLTPAAGAADDSFGCAVAVSGPAALVGALARDSGGLDDAGAAYLVVRESGVWSEAQLLLPGDPAAGDWFGGSVALDGTTALAGARGHSVGGLVDAGAAYVFRVEGLPVAPLVRGFTPTSGPVGTEVRVSGSGLTGATDVSFAGTTAAFSPVSDTEIKATVPTGASTGPISVTTPNGTATSDASFAVTVVTPPPTVTSFLPTSGVVGSTVTVNGTGFTGATAVAFNGLAAASFAVESDTRLTATVPSGASSGPIAVTTPNGTGASAASFAVTVVPPAPTVIGFLPTSGIVGSSVSVTGAAFTGATAVTFNGLAAASFTVVSDSQLTATVPAGATSGPIAVTTPRGTGASAASFTVTLVPPAPTVISFLPASGVVGSSVSVTGAGFNGATAVTFNGVAAASFKVVSDSEVTATVPAGASSGPIAVTTTYGTGKSAGSFTVTTVPPAPTVSGFSPSSGPAGTAVTITGAGFTGATAVAFNGLAAAKFTVASDTQLTATVPAGATNGPLAVTTTYGTGTSAGSFVVSKAPKAPTLLRLSPTSGKRGATVTLTGKGFGARRSGGTVRFGGVKSLSYISWSDTRIKCVVPSAAKLGALKVRVVNANGASGTKSFTVKRK